MFEFIKYRPRLFTSIFVGLLFFVFIPNSLAIHSITRAIIAWNVATWLYLILALL